MMRIKILLLLLLSLVLGSNIRSQSLEGDWQFQAILNSKGDSLFKISSTDILSFAADSFDYQLAAKNLQASGKFSQLSDSLIFNYLAPSDTQRTYTFQVQGDSLLNLEESGISYLFKRTKVKTGL